MRPMSRYVLCLGVLVAFQGPLWSDDRPTDGIYYAAQGADAARKLAGTAVDTDRGKAVLGALIPQAVASAKLVSRDNFNRGYELLVTTAFDAKKGDLSKVLVLGRHAYLSYGGGSSGNETSHLSFRVPGGEAVTEVERHFQIKATHRRHPGHALRVAFVPVKEPMEAGGPMEVELRIENVGDKPIVFVRGGMNRGSRDNQFSFVAHGRRAVPDVGDPHHMGGIMTTVRLAAGGRHTQRVDLARWFAFEPGGYTLIGSYAMQFLDTAVEDWGPTVWEDFATAAFHIRVEAAKAAETDAAPSKGS